MNPILRSKQIWHNFLGVFPYSPCWHKGNGNFNQCFGRDGLEMNPFPWALQAFLHRAPLCKWQRCVCCKENSGKRLPSWVRLPFAECTAAQRWDPAAHTLRVAWSPGSLEMGGGTGKTTTTKELYLLHLSMFWNLAAEMEVLRKGLEES